jgi:hypothetical protein
MARRVSQYAYIHSTDFEFERHGDAREFDKIATVCVGRATTALETPGRGYTKLQCDHIGDVFRSMRATHRTIKRLLDHDGPIDPETVDTLALARIQLECLYAVCLMLEDPKYVTYYMQDYWRKKYVQYLLDKEETKNLARYQPHFAGQLEQLSNLAIQFGITQGQIVTVEIEELGITEPPGFVKESIPHFPTPGITLKELPESDKKRMLQRLYAKYVDLCSFAHGLAQSNLLKLMFDNRSYYRKLSTDSQIKNRYEMEVKSEAYLTSFYSIAQCTAELTVLYPMDIEVVQIATKAWNDLSRASLLTKAIWEIRTRKLLGALA